VNLAKIFAIAETELRALMRGKTFLISIVLLPLVVLGMSFSQNAISRHVDNKPRRFAVIDASGRYYDAVAASARARDTTTTMVAIAAGEPAGPRFEPERVDVGGRALDDVRLALSDRVRQEQLFAFVEIPREPDREKLRYYSDHAAQIDLREWLAKTVDDEMHSARYREAQLSPELVEALSRKVSAETLGLWTRAPDGHIQPAEKQDELRALVVPLVPVMLLFFFILMSAQQLMHSVVAEKTSRISEVLLGAVTPTELMAGKLLGSVAVSLLLGLAYLAGGLGVAARMNLLSAIPPSLIAWFLVFLVLAMLLYGSVSMALGALCSDVKDAQNLMLPAMLPLMVPMFMLMPVLQSPSSALSTGLSLFPLMTPLVMLLRVGLHPTPPVWQVVLGAMGTLATTALCIWAAGRIFRVGLLAHGKTASFGQMLRWITAK
jgi:ABC-2 type transport system permease protein